MFHRASSAAINEAVRAIMREKPLNTLNGYPNTENVDHFQEQMAKHCASVSTTRWGGHHGCLYLALRDNALSTATKGTVTDSALRKPEKSTHPSRKTSPILTNSP